MNKNDCKQVLFYAAETLNERMGTMFNEENLVLSCFQTSNQEEVFELGGDSFYKRYCMDSTLSREEDGAINAGYAIWRELIAEVIAFEMDDRCVVLPLKEKKDILKYYVREIEAAQKKVAKHKPFDNPLYMELLELVYRNLRINFVEIDREFILQLGSLYLCFVMQLEVKKLGRYLQTGNDTIGR